LAERNPAVKNGRAGHALRLKAFPVSYPRNAVPYCATRAVFVILVTSAGRRNDRWGKIPVLVQRRLT